VKENYGDVSGTGAGVGADGNSDFAAVSSNYMAGVGNDRLSTSNLNDQGENITPLIMDKTDKGTNWTPWSWKA